MSSTSGVLVEAALKLPPLDRGTVVAGHQGVVARKVRWVTVMEGPVEDFVAPGEFVLTIGAGCDEEGFTRFAREIADAGAAALCVSVGSAAPLTRVPQAVVELGDRLDFPVIELPWEIRFGDVLRALAERLLSEHYSSRIESEELPAGLTEALLARDGLTSIAEAVESMLDHPVILLDADLQPLVLGPTARARISAGTLTERILVMPDSSRNEFRGTLNGNIVATVPDFGLGLGNALGAAAQAQGQVLGYVLALEFVDQPSTATIARRALQHAAIAAAIELLRRRAAAEAVARVHGDFLWEVAGRQTSTQELAAKATLLGYSLHTLYEVVLAVDDTDATEMLDVIVRDVAQRAAATGIHAARRGQQVLIIVPDSVPPMLRPKALVDRLIAEYPTGSISWGLADRTVTLRTLADGVDRAERAIEVACALNGPRGIADAATLEPFFLLIGLAKDQETLAASQRLLEPLVRYDDGSSGDLCYTLQVYIEENGNTSSAARRLFLNRHSLMYRLRKIETLTCRDLSNSDDRFLLDASLRLGRMTKSNQQIGEQ